MLTSQRVWQWPWPVHLAANLRLASRYGDLHVCDSFPVAFVNSAYESARCLPRVCSVIAVGEQFDCTNPAFSGAGSPLQRCRALATERCQAHRGPQSGLDAVALKPPPRCVFAAATAAVTCTRRPLPVPARQEDEELFTTSLLPFTTFYYLFTTLFTTCLLLFGES